MKPLHIGLLVLVGAVGGAMVVKFTQRPQAPAAPVVAAVSAPAPAPSPAPADAAPPPLTGEPVPEAAPPEPVPEAAPAPPAAPASKPVRVAAPAKPVRPHIVQVARNLPPPAPARPAPVAASEPPASVPVETAPASEPEPEPAPVPAAEPVVEPPPPPPVAPSVKLKPGLLLNVRLGEALSSERNQPGDTFTATLDSPVAADGFVIAERGARVEGRVVEAQKGTHMSQLAALTVELTRLRTSDGQYIPIKTDAFRTQAARQAGENVGIVAAAAGVGAIIGAIAGGGKGAGIGAGVGGAAGVGGVAATRARSAELRTETRIAFRLHDPVTITERVN